MHCKQKLFPSCTFFSQNTLGVVSLCINVVLQIRFCLTFWQEIKATVEGEYKLTELENESHVTDVIKKANFL